MSIRIGTNIASLGAQRRLGEATYSLSQATERLSSGQRINSASDDAAGLAIGNSLNTDARVFTQSIRNLNDAQSLLSIAQGGLEALSSVSMRQLELAHQAANGSLTSQQRSSLDAEANALVKEYNRIVATTEFNGIKLLDGSAETAQIQAGFGSATPLFVGLVDELQRSVGDGTFNPRATLGMDLSRELILVDLNGDGHLDLAGTEFFQNRLMVRLGDGRGSFGSAMYSSTETGPWGITSGDFDGDGVIDLATTSQSSDSVNILYGNNNGRFTAPVNITTVDAPTFIASGDLDGDGILDLVHGSSTQNGLRVLYGNEGGGFDNPISIGGSAPNMQPVLADLNNDGRLDIAGSGSFEYLMNTGSGFEIRTHSNASTFVTGIGVGDVNGDRNLDLIGFSGTNGAIALGNGDGTFRATISTGVGFGNEYMRLADLNGDEFEDIVALDFNDGVEIFMSNGDGSFLTPSQFNFATNSRGIGLGDLNHDGAADIVAGDWDATRTVSIFMGNTQTISYIETLDLRSIAAARQSMGVVADTLARINSQLSSFGASESRLKVAGNVLQVARENYRSAAGRIMDADVAVEAARLAAASVLQEAAASVLGQANVQPTLALTLLRSIR